MIGVPHFWNDVEIFLVRLPAMLRLSFRRSCTTINYPHPNAWVRYLLCRKNSEFVQGFFINHWGRSKRHCRKYLKKRMKGLIYKRTTSCSFVQNQFSPPVRAPNKSLPFLLRIGSLPPRWTSHSRRAIPSRVPESLWFPCRSRPSAANMPVCCCK